MLMRPPPLTMRIAAALTGIVSRKELFAMNRVIGPDLGATNVCGTVMEDWERARKLERVSQIFCRAQEDWAVTHFPGRSTGDMKKDADGSAGSSRTSICCERVRN